MQQYGLFVCAKTLATHSNILSFSFSLSARWRLERRDNNELIGLANYIEALVIIFITRNSWDVKKVLNASPELTVGKNPESWLSEWELLS